MYKVATGFVLTIAFLSIASINISMTRWQHDHQVKSGESVITISSSAPSSVALSSSHNPSSSSSSPSSSSSTTTFSVVKTTATVYKNADLSVVLQESATSKSVNQQNATVIVNRT